MDSSSPAIAGQVIVEPLNARQIGELGEMVRVVKGRLPPFAAGEIARFLEL